MALVGGAVAASLFFLLGGRQMAREKFTARVESQPPLVIELREDGFSPKNATVMKGQLVTFTTSRNVYFWPASDLHPTHEIYADFDPREPLGPGESWSFRFLKVGEWSYHDHLAPYFVGAITVRAPP